RRRERHRSDSHWKDADAGFTRRKFARRPAEHRRLPRREVGLPLRCRRSTGPRLGAVRAGAETLLAAVSARSGVDLLERGGIMVSIQFIGSGDAFGSGGRFQTCIRLTHQSGSLLIDCGASSLVALKRAAVPPASIDAILLSHLHGDHFGGV